MFVSRRLMLLLSLSGLSLSRAVLRLSLESPRPVRSR